MHEKRTQNKFGTKRGPTWSAKFILRELECKIYFAKFGVQNLFCKDWSAKFILRSLECKIYFAIDWSAKFILQLIGVQNLFCN